MRRLIVKYRDTAVICSKTAEPIEIPFGLWTQVGQRKHVLGGVHAGASWRMPLNRPCAAAMRPACQITLITCFISLQNYRENVCKILISRCQVDT